MYCTVHSLTLHRVSMEGATKVSQHTKTYAQGLSKGNSSRQPSGASRIPNAEAAACSESQPRATQARPWSLETSKPPSKPGRRCACSQVSQKLLRAARHPPITRPRTTPKAPTHSSHVRLSRSTSSLANPQRHLPVGRPHLTPPSRARRPRSIYKARNRMDVYQSLPAPWA